MSDLSDFEDAMGAMAMAALKRLAQEIWHRMHACSCDMGYFREGIPCEIGQEEIEVRKAEKLFNGWDALGLGYIGPRI